MVFEQITYIYQESKLILGNATSFAPIKIGKKKLPKTAGKPGTTKRKIIITPCRVKKEL